jgi:hypothetical protein
MESIDAVLRSTISRLVAVLVPVLSGVLGAGLLWLQNAVGIDLQVDPAVAAAFIGTIVLGGCLVGLKWLEGRAQFEAAALELKKLHELGKAEQGVVTNRPVGPLD